jgi:hypothetical protein
VKSKPARKRVQSQKKAKPAVKKSSGNDPFYLYD